MARMAHVCLSLKMSRTLNESSSADEKKSNAIMKLADTTIVGDQQEVKNCLGRETPVGPVGICILAHV